MHSDFSDFSTVRSSLASFVSYVNDILKKLVYSNEDGQGNTLFAEDFTEDLKSALAEVQPQFDNVLSGIYQADEKTLRQHGLWGVQLRLKLRIFELFERQFRNKGKAALSKLLDVIDDLLDSILDAVPGGKAISEFKDAVKNCIK